MNALGTHLLVELRDCDAGLLNNLKRTKEIMVQAAEAARATVLGAHFHRFSPCGITGVVVIAESHISIHTWPEYRYAAVDVFTCGDTLLPDVAATYLVEQFQSKSPTFISVKRGSLAWGDQLLPHKPETGEAILDGRLEELQMVS